MYLDEADNHMEPHETDRLIIGKFCSIATGVKFMMRGTQGHNIFALLNKEGLAKIPEFAWSAIKEIRKSVFNFLNQETENSYVLTNVLYEVKEDHKIYNQVEQMAIKRGSLFVPVKLLVSEEENLKRITEPSRRERWKTIDPQEVYNGYQFINITHPNLLELAVTDLRAREAAEKILEHVAKLQSGEGGSHKEYCLYDS